jgi:hypothetical protein
LFPITIRASPIYMASSKTIMYLVTIKTPYLPSYTLPYDVYAYNEGIYNNTKYIWYLTKYGITVYSFIKSKTSNSVLVNVTIKYSDATPRGVYVIPVSAAFPVAVTTFGVMYNGYSYYYFYNDIPIILTVRIYY